MRTARRVSQILFFALFVYLFLQASYPYESEIPSDLFLRASPLAAVITIVSSRAFVASVVIGLAILVLTIPFGRFFCGWICPLGTLLDFTDKLLSRPRKKVGQRDSLRFRSWKYALLTAVLLGSVFSIQFAGYFDPISIITRTFTTALYPWFAQSVLTVLGAASDIPWLSDPAYSLLDTLQQRVLPVSMPHFRGSFLIFLIFLGIVVLGRLQRRFWCRNLCPLGALLGLFARFRLTRRIVTDACIDCGLCQLHCRMNAVEDDFRTTLTSECIECQECAAICPTNAIHYTIGLPRAEADKRVDLSRRHFVESLVGGATAAVALNVGFTDRRSQGSAIRPPGALVEKEFLDRCIRCHECVRICSTTGACLQPSFLEAGLEAFWTPKADMRYGYCEYNCTLCSEVCPTGAIFPLDLQTKQKTRMGIAYFDHTRCIPWYRYEDCLVCEEHCPVPDKAIRFDVREVVTPRGEKKVVKFPYVVEELCIGCGICENKCPVEGIPGIFVTRAGEERFLADGTKVSSEGTDQTYGG